MDISSDIVPFQKVVSKIFASKTSKIRKEVNPSSSFAVRDAVTSENLQKADRGVWIAP